MHSSLRPARLPPLADGTRSAALRFNSRRCGHDGLATSSAAVVGSFHGSPKAFHGSPAPPTLGRAIHPSVPPNPARFRVRRPGTTSRVVAAEKSPRLLANTASATGPTSTDASPRERRSRRGHRGVSFRHASMPRPWTRRGPTSEARRPPPRLIWRRVRRLGRRRETIRGGDDGGEFRGPSRRADVGDRHVAYFGGGGEDGGERRVG